MNKTFVTINRSTIKKNPNAGRTEQLVPVRKEFSLTDVNHLVPDEHEKWECIRSSNSSCFGYRVDYLCYTEESTKELMDLLDDLGKKFTIVVNTPVSVVRHFFPEPEWLYEYDNVDVKCDDCWEVFKVRELKGDDFWDGDDYRNSFCPKCGIEDCCELEYEKIESVEDKMGYYVDEKDTYIGGHGPNMALGNGDVMINSVTGWKTINSTKSLEIEAKKYILDCGCSEVCEADIDDESSDEENEFDDGLIHGCDYVGLEDCHSFCICNCESCEGNDAHDECSFLGILTTDEELDLLNTRFDGDLYLSYAPDTPDSEDVLTEEDNTALDRVEEILEWLWTLDVSEDVNNLISYYVAQARNILCLEDHESYGRGTFGDGDEFVLNLESTKKDHDDVIKNGLELFEKSNPTKQGVINLLIELRKCSEEAEDERVEKHEEDMRKFDRSIALLEESK